MSARSKTNVLQGGDHVGIWGYLIYVSSVVFILVYSLMVRESMNKHSDTQGVCIISSAHDLQEGLNIYFAHRNPATSQPVSEQSTYTPKPTQNRSISDRALYLI